MIKLNKTQENKQPDTISILFKDKNVIVAYKPPKMPVQSDKSSDADLKTLLEKQLALKSPLYLINRIDRPVGGLVALCLNKEAASKLSARLTTDSFRKTYLAVVTGKMNSDTGKLVDFIKKTSDNLSMITDETDKDAKRAVLKYKTIATLEDDKWGMLSLLEIDLLTGRHHQIRVQLSNAGCGIWGDTKYNTVFSLTTGKWHQIALCAVGMNFKHPLKKEWVDVRTQPPKEYPWSAFKLEE